MYCIVTVTEMSSQYHELANSTYMHTRSSSPGKRLLKTWQNKKHNSSYAWILFNEVVMENCR